MGSTQLKHGDLTAEILRGFFHVYNVLGYGFLEKVYENALKRHLERRGFSVFQQQAIRVFFEGETVGVYFADLIVEDKVIVEVKTAESIADAHVHQLKNYLRATPVEVGLLLNFGEQPEYRRQVYSNSRKRFRPR